VQHSEHRSIYSIHNNKTKQKLYIPGVECRLLDLESNVDDLLFAWSHSQGLLEDLEFNITLIIKNIS